MCDDWICVLKERIGFKEMKVIGCLGVWSGGGWELKQSAWLMIHWEWLTGLIEKVWGLMNCRNCRLQQYIHYCTRWRQVEDRGWHTVSKWDEVELSLCFQVLHTPYSMSLKSNPITTTTLHTVLYFTYHTTSLLTQVHHPLIRSNVLAHRISF